MINITHLGNQEFKVNIRGHEFISSKTREDKTAPPSPPELFVSSIAACIGVYAVGFLSRHDIKTDGINITADYTTKKENNQSWIDSIKVRVNLPEKLDEKYINPLQKVMEACMVHESVRRNPEVTIELI